LWVAPTHRRQTGTRPEGRGWLQEITGFERNRLYRYQPYMALFHRETVEATFAAQTP
jgi:hypothetical protein